MALLLNQATCTSCRSEWLGAQLRLGYVCSLQQHGSHMLILCFGQHATMADSCQPYAHTTGNPPCYQTRPAIMLQLSDGWRTASTCQHSVLTAAYQSAVVTRGQAVAAAALLRTCCQKAAIVHDPWIP